MCGIAGIYDPRAALGAEAFEALLVRMTDTMVPRGPDGSGHWVDDESGIGFGHRRLSIIDVSEAGAQPMHSASGRYVLTYNGEIYNARYLRGDLESAGVRFRGHSDSEVLVEAIDRWGIDRTLDLIDGMYAFGVWDRKDRALTLVRDRIGEKPLCYGELPGGGVVFGSTLDALRVHPTVSSQVDPTSLAMYLRYNYVPAPRSILAGVRKLAPGAMVRVSAAGVGEQVPYWSYVDVLNSVEPFRGSDRDAVDRLDELLRESVADRLVSDVPIGAFLSGGVDSATIVAVAQSVSNEPLKTFTIGSTHDDFDESAAARAIARHIGTDHTELIVTDQDALDLVPTVAGVYDEPFGDASQLPTLLVSKLARSKVTVSLSGDAGDELFGGYNRYTSTPAIRAKAARVPGRIRSGAGAALGRVPPRVWDRAAAVLPEHRRPQQLGLKVTKALEAVLAPSDRAAYEGLVEHWADAEAMVRGRVGNARQEFAWDESRSFAEQMMTADILTYLPGDILTKVDRAAMSVSLESRVPYLSRSIAEFSASLPLSMKIRDGESKWVLRQVLDRYVPRELMNRPKAGFGLPIDEWLRGPLMGWGEKLLGEPAFGEHVDVGVVRGRWDEHQAGRVQAGYDLWGCLRFAASCECQ